MPENKMPQFLYHYTSIESLALILKNHTIRFSSLDRMDDLQEKESKDVRNIGQFVYVSSWTSESTESIPMWNMYASLNAGIRIKLKSNPFQLHNNTAQELQKVSKTSVIDNTNGQPVPSYIPFTEMWEKGFYCVQAMNEIVPHRVEYTQDENKLYPSILNTNGEQFSISLGEMGRYKNLHWEFQKEWRYILQILPLNLNQAPEMLEPSFQLVANRILHGVEKQAFPYYDMKIDDTAFSSMEITVSPRLSPGNWVILESLIDKYNPSAQINKSTLQDLL